MPILQPPLTVESQAFGAFELRCSTLYHAGPYFFHRGGPTQKATMSGLASRTASVSVPSHATSRASEFRTCGMGRALCVPIVGGSHAREARSVSPIPFQGSTDLGAERTSEVGHGSRGSVFWPSALLEVAGTGRTEMLPQPSAALCCPVRTSTGQIIKGNAYAMDLASDTAVSESTCASATARSPARAAPTTGC